jgi:hypothetical protein
MATDFRALLGVKGSAVEKPKPLPVGTYYAQVTGWEPTESSQKKTPGVKIGFQLTSADADVDQEQLAEVGGAAAVGKRKLSTTFWLTEDSTYRLKEFVENACKIDMSERTFAECLPECIQATVKLALKHRLSEKQEIILEVDEVIAAE